MKKPTLYVTGITEDNVVLYGGLFTARDEMGMPLDLVCDMVRINGGAVDWVEFLADSGRQENDFKTDSAREQMVAVIGEERGAEAWARFRILGALTMREVGGGYPAICRAIVERKRENGRKFLSYLKEQIA